MKMSPNGERGKSRQGESAVKVRWGGKRGDLRGGGERWNLREELSPAEERKSLVWLGESGGSKGKMVKHRQKRKNFPTETFL